MHPPYWLLLALFALAAAPAAALTRIVVDFGHYPSAEAAAVSEDAVEWRDADSADDAICTQAFAAVELQYYLREIGGAPTDFAIVDDADAPPDGNLVLVGDPDTNAAAREWLPDVGLEELAPEAYQIATRDIDGRRITLIAGGGRIGTLYGAYDLLYRLGVRWFAPGAVHEDVPLRALPRLPETNVTETPDFDIRGFHAWENRGDLEFLLWMARNRLNYWCVAQEDRAFMHKLGIRMSCGGHILQPDYLGPAKLYPYDHASFDSDDDLPEDPYPVSPEFEGDANGDGKVSYFEAHPEWYALQGGKRVPGIQDWGGGVNYCSSNADATAELVRNVVADLVDGRWADADIINAWMLDVGKWCECENCAALGTRTDKSLLFVHELDQGIKAAQAEGRINRPIWLLFLAYADVIEPPTRPLPEDFDYETCIATYFPIVRCYVHEFADAVCDKNASYDKHLYGWAVDPERHYKGQLCIGEYYNVSGYKCLPIVYKRTMAPDIPNYHSLGARHFHYMHCTTRNWGNKWLTNYQMARQLWDVDTDCEALWEDGFRRRYGPAAAEMRAFYGELDGMLCNVSELKYGLGRRLPKMPDNLFPAAHLSYEPSDNPMAGPSLSEIIGHADRARAVIDGALARDLPRQVAARIAEDGRLFQYGENTVRFYDALCRALFAIREGRAEDLRAAYSDAKALAAALEADEESTRYSSTHANAANALEASYAGAVLAQIEMALGPDSEAVSTLEPDGEPLVIRGDEFLGGGGPLYGHHLNAYPGRIKVSDHGNYVYARNNPPHDCLTAWFKLEAAPEAALSLKLVGLACGQPPGTPVPEEVLVNGQPVFAGAAPFVEDKLTEQVIEVPAEALQAGINKLEICNATENGPVGNRPWFGIDRVELRVGAK